MLRRARVLAPLPRCYGAARVCDVSGACCLQLRGAGGRGRRLIVARRWYSVSLRSGPRRNFDSPFGCTSTSAYTCDDRWEVSMSFFWLRPPNLLLVDQSDSLRETASFLRSRGVGALWGLV